MFLKSFGLWVVPIVDRIIHADFVCQDWWLFSFFSPLLFIYFYVFVVHNIFSFIVPPMLTYVFFWHFYIHVSTRHPNLYVKWKEKKIKHKQLVSFSPMNFRTHFLRIFQLVFFYLLFFFLLFGYIKSSFKYIKHISM